MNIGKTMQGYIAGVFTGTAFPVTPSFNLSVTAINPGVVYSPVGTPKPVTFSLSGSVAVSSPVTFNDLGGSVEYVVVTDSATDEVLFYTELSSDKVFPANSSFTYAQGDIIIDMSTMLSPALAILVHTWLTGGGPVVAPSPLYMELSTSSIFTPPPAVGNYNKKSVVLVAEFDSVSRSTHIKAPSVIFDTASADWGYITHVFITDGVSPLLSCPIANVERVTSGYTLAFPDFAVDFEIV